MSTNDVHIKSRPPLLNLVIMIKNGVTVIERTLRAIHPYIDRWDVLDTGSSDGTQELIQRVMSEPVSKVTYDLETDSYQSVPDFVTPGKIHQAEFINFRDSRNQLLDLAGSQCTYTLMLDDSYVVNGCERLLKVLTVGRERSIRSYSLRITTDSICYPSERILSTEHHIRYKRRIHEIPDNPFPSVVIEDDSIFIYDVEDTSMAQRSKARYARDIEWLMLDFIDDPEDPRTMFYLARTFALCERYQESYWCLLKRIAMTRGSDVETKGSPGSPVDEETFICMTDLAYVCEGGLKAPWSDVERFYLDAYHYMPHRAEPLFAIGQKYLELAGSTPTLSYGSETYANRFNAPFPVESPLVEHRKHFSGPETIPIHQSLRQYQVGNMHKAYVYLHAADAIPFPMNSRLFVERSIYEYQIPSSLAIVAVNLGYFDEAKRAAEKALAYKPFELSTNLNSTSLRDDLERMRAIVSHCNLKLGIRDELETQFLESIVAKTLWDSTTGDTRGTGTNNLSNLGEWVSRPVAVFNCGVNTYHKRWGPTTVGLGGSETMVLAMARQFSLKGNYATYVFSNVEDGVIGHDDGVVYLDQRHYDPFLKLLTDMGVVVDVLFAARYANYLRSMVSKRESEAKIRPRRQYLWLHDTCICTDANPRTEIDLNSVDGFLVLSQWHRDTIAPYGIPLDKLVVTRNAIDSDLFRRKLPTKVKHRFVYSSCLSRGVEVLLDLWPMIRRLLPDATLRVFGEITPYLESLWGVKRVESFFHRVEYLKLHGVEFHRRVSKACIAREYLESQVWFYPTSFSETYCITALEAQAAGCLCVTSDLAALKETCSRGYLLVDPESPESFKVKRLVELVKRLDSNDPELTKRLADARQWALTQSYETLFQDWVRLMNLQTASSKSNPNNDLMY